MLAVRLEAAGEGSSLVLARGTTAKPHFERFAVPASGSHDVQLQPLEVCFTTILAPGTPLVNVVASYPVDQASTPCRWFERDEVMSEWPVLPARG